MKDDNQCAGEPITKIVEKLTSESGQLRNDLYTVATRISHDLRTPLGGIISAAEALKEMLPDNEPSSKALLTSLLDSTDDLERLIKRISFVIKASVKPQPKQMVSMGTVVSGTLQRLESKILNTGATILEPASWPDVNGVLPWLEVVWWNLIANALQHAGKAPRIELGWSKEAEEVRFWIADSGKGVEGKQRDKLFQPFHSLYDIDSSRGLGLSIVQRLVELQGGVCGYEINAKGSAIFYFTLPA